MMMMRIAVQTIRYIHRPKFNLYLLLLYHTYEEAEEIYNTRKGKLGIKDMKIQDISINDNIEYN